MSKPEVLIDEEVISGGAGATLATLGDLSIRWGTESLLDEPEPSTATVTFMFSGGVDVGRIGIGKRLIIRQRIASIARVPTISATSRDWSPPVMKMPVAPSICSTVASLFASSRSSMSSASMDRTPSLPKASL